nr:plasmid mobilization relaxosome protein MobC [uncultured Sphingobacterium sp.]
MEKEIKRSRIIGVRLTLVEFEKIEKNWKASTCRKLSEYVRRLILGKPIVSTYRNKSMDDFMAELMKLRIDLNGIGNNFNQVVKKLHTSPQTDAISRLLVSYELEKRILLKQVADIKLFIEKNGQQW